MYTAAIELNGWYKETFIISGETPSDIMTSFSDVQDINCLYIMGMQSETSRKGKKSIQTLGNIIDSINGRTLTTEELQKMNIELSIGGFRCLSVLEGEDSISKLKEIYPNATIK